MTGVCAFLPYRSSNRKVGFGSDLARSPSPPGMSAICANATWHNPTGVDGYCSLMGGLRKGNKSTMSKQKCASVRRVSGTAASLGFPGLSTSARLAFRRTAARLAFMIAERPGRLPCRGTRPCSLRCARRARGSAVRRLRGPPWRDLLARSPGVALAARGPKVFRVNVTRLHLARVVRGCFAALR
jgi:hypothetical protein